ncbi:MAG: right-handed parallel beta-helix repeat-containing protein, partial [Phycisphaerales bacterium]
EGFTITTAGLTDRAGIACSGQSPEISGNIITGNKRSGIRLQNSEALIADNIISGNEAYASDVGGGGIQIKSDQHKTVKIVGCLLEGNTAPYRSGGGLYANALGTIWMVNCTLRDNSADNKGGGVFTAGGACRGSKRRRPLREHYSDIEDAELPGHMQRRR